jgi:hypothetical protein
MKPPCKSRQHTLMVFQKLCLFVRCAIVKRHRPHCCNRNRVITRKPPDQPAAEEPTPPFRRSPPNEGGKKGGKKREARRDHYVEIASPSCCRRSRQREPHPSLNPPDLGTGNPAQTGSTSIIGPAAQASSKSSGCSALLRHHRAIIPGGSGSNQSPQ